jgi:hypothetical protein
MVHAEPTRNYSASGVTELVAATLAEKKATSSATR